jgi:hypothetical protein
VEEDARGVSELAVVPVERRTLTSLQ